MTTTEDTAAELTRLTKIRDRALNKAVTTANRHCENATDNLRAERLGNMYSEQARLAQEAIDNLKRSAELRVAMINVQQAIRALGPALTRVVDELGVFPGPGVDGTSPPVFSLSPAQQAGTACAQCGRPRSGHEDEAHPFCRAPSLATPGAATSTFHPVQNPSHPKGPTVTYRTDTAASLANRDRELAEVIAYDHGHALLDNLPCELCGRVEQHPNHRGIGHTHTPAETPIGRAHVLIALVMGTRLVVPGYVFSTAMMMVGQNNDAGEIVDADHAEALEVDRTVYPLLRGGQR